MKWMCYGAGLLVATASLLAGAGVAAMLFAAGAMAIMAGIARRVVGAELPSGFGQSPEGGLLQGIAMYLWGARVLDLTPAGGPLLVATLALFIVGWFLEIRQRNSYAPDK